VPDDTSPLLMTAGEIAGDLGLKVGKVKRFIERRGREERGSGPDTGPLRFGSSALKRERLFIPLIVAFIFLWGLAIYANSFNNSFICKLPSPF